MDADAGPCHAWPARSEVTEPNAFAAEPSSLPIPSQAAAASNIGPEPGPSSSSSELTSGGHTEKFTTAPPRSVVDANKRLGSAHWTKPKTRSPYRFDACGRPNCAE